MSTNILNVPNGMVLVPVQMQSGGTGFVPVQMQSGGSVSVPVQMQSGGSGSVLGSNPDTSLLEFKRKNPQALGTVQIMVGALLFTIGFVFCFFGDQITVYSGVFAWAPICYIIAGSLTVAADRTMSHCMIKGSMGMSIVAAVMSGVAIILCGLDSGGVMLYWRDDPFYRALSMSVSGVLVVFNVLEFFISICVSVFCCKAVCSCCCCQQTPMQAVVIGNHLPEVSRVMATPSPYAPPIYTEVGHTLSDGGSSQGCGK